MNPCLFVHSVILSLKAIFLHVQNNLTFCDAIKMDKFHVCVYILGIIFADFLKFLRKILFICKKDLCHLTGRVQVATSSFSFSIRHFGPS